MGKVITGAGLNEFIESGKHDTIKNHREPVESKKETPVAVSPATNEPAKADSGAATQEPPVEADGDLMPEETLEQAKLKIAKKHRELKAEKALRQRLQEERDENERLAESQFNQRRLYENENLTLKQQLAELQARTTPAPQVQELKAPDKADPKFQDEKGQFQWDKFTEAQADFKVEQFKREQVQKENEKEQQAITAALETRIKAATEKYPDFMEVVGAQDAKIFDDRTAYIMQFLRESEQGPDLAYYFAKNREELTKIMKLKPIMALARLGKLETRFEKAPDEKVETKADIAPAMKTSNAPPPITPLTGSSPTPTDATKHSFNPSGDPEAFRRLREQYRAAERAKRNK